MNASAIALSRSQHAAAPPKSRNLPADRVSDRGVWACAGLIVLAVVGAYHNSFEGPFTFDDEGSIRENPTIRQLWPIGPVLHPPAEGQAVQRRPVVNLSLAVNYALGGLNVWGYHATNLLLHVLAALTLLGVVYRTLDGPRWRGRLGGGGLAAATAIAAIWAIHPLQAEAVTYVIQRTEVLAGLFYLLTLYAVIRGSSSPGPRRWYVLAAGACLLAMGSKESAVSAPLVVLVYDRIFLASSWREIFRKRWGLYAALAGAWGLVLAMIPQGQEGSRIFGEGSAQVEYALSQGEAIVRYLKLCFWPFPLVVDYGNCPAQDVGRAGPYLAAVAALLAATGLALWRSPAWGFLGLWFFAILAPSSSIVPLPQQVAAEKRMYLPLAAVVTLAGLGAWVLWARLARRWPLPRRWPLGVLAAVVAAALAARTFARNDDYRTAESLWRSAVEARPENPRAHASLGYVLQSQGRLDEAIGQYQQAVCLEPGFVEANHDLACAMMRTPSLPRAGGRSGQALRLNVDLAPALNNLAWIRATHADPKRRDGAQALCLAQHACRLVGRKKWGFLDTLAAAYAEAGRFPDAIATAQEALALAKSVNNLPAVVEEIQSRLLLYKSGQAYREESPAADTKP